VTLKKITHSYLECDIEGCTAWFYSNTGNGVADMKKSARQAGWKIFSDSIRAYHQCPECAQKDREWIKSQGVSA
jgi:hypothetical protein